MKSLLLIKWHHLALLKFLWRQRRQARCQVTMVVTRWCGIHVTNLVFKILNLGHDCLCPYLHAWHQLTPAPAYTQVLYVEEGSHVELIKSQQLRKLIAIHGVIRACEPSSISLSSHPSRLKCVKRIAAPKLANILSREASRYSEACQHLVASEAAQRMIHHKAREKGEKGAKGLGKDSPASS